MPLRLCKLKTDFLARCPFMVRARTILLGHDEPASRLTSATACHAYLLNVFGASLTQRMPRCRPGHFHIVFKQLLSGGVGHVRHRRQRQPHHLDGGQSAACGRWKWREVRGPMVHAFLQWFAWKALLSSKLFPSFSPPFFVHQLDEFGLQTATVGYAPYLRGISSSFFVCLRSRLPKHSRANGNWNSEGPGKRLFRKWSFQQRNPDPSPALDPPYKYTALPAVRLCQKSQPTTGPLKCSLRKGACA